VTDPAPGLIRRWLHWLFEASLLVKGTLAGAESLSGLFLLLTANARLLRFVDWLVANEVAQDPADPLAKEIEHMAEGLSLASQHFYAWYLMGHGLLKLAMVLGLARRILWAYPASMALLAAFVVFEMDEFLRSHSPVLLALSCLDLLMIFLVWREYAAIRSARAPTGA
jgi:uncharacterized membrane protein